MLNVDVLKVFVGPGGEGGNPLGVVVEGSAVPNPALRQAIAAHLNYSETVFVDDPETALLRIYTPVRELPFAGHPLVGTSWLLARSGRRPAELRPPAGTVPTWTEGEITWIRGESTGSAAVRVTGSLGRGLKIRQGAGSELLTRIGPAGTAEVGGRVAFVETRKLDPATIRPARL